jgi:methylated-DNA-protein-cysteine methyltransferase related protein
VIAWSRNSGSSGTTRSALAVEASHNDDCCMTPSKKQLRELLLPPKPASSHRTRANDLDSNAALRTIWDVVAMIPRGRVRTYGDVARVAGFPGRARQAGYALRVVPPELHLPWHRVVGAGGRIVFPRSSSQYREQGRRLRSEGVAVRNGRVPAFVVMDTDLR